MTLEVSVLRRDRKEMQVLVKRYQQVPPPFALHPSVSVPTCNEKELPPLPFTGKGQEMKILILMLQWSNMRPNS
jgi:hypothetical protein